MDNSEEAKRATELEKIRQEEGQKILDFQQNLKSQSLKSFSDKPDEIKVVRCIEASQDTIVIEWEKPHNHNSPILHYNIYLAE